MRKVWAQRKPRGPAPQREPMGLCLSAFDYLTQSSLSLRTIRSDVSLSSGQTSSAANGVCAFSPLFATLFIESPSELDFSLGCPLRNIDSNMGGAF